jgi:hypothetical protein
MEGDPVSEMRFVQNTIQWTKFIHQANKVRTLQSQKIIICAHSASDEVCLVYHGLYQKFQMSSALYAGKKNVPYDSKDI